MTVCSGKDNVFIGCFAGRYVTTGSCNIAIGKWAYGNQANASAHNNIAIGCKAAADVTSASGLIAIGRNAGHANAEGGHSIIIGQSAGITGTDICGNIIRATWCNE